MKKLPIGIQTFSKLLKEDCVYVDKTALIYQLITQGSSYFLARPRRFGKSLLVSTIAEIFLGNKELFEGLAISTLPYDWKKHPVVMISFSDISYTSPEILENGIKIYLQDIAKHYELNLRTDLVPGEMLRDLIKKLSQQNSVILLIDEYDYPILQHITNTIVAEKMRDILKSLYAVIKGLDPYLRFVFLTGVSKFSKTSLFSGLNNLKDISLDAKYNTLLGYTKNEISSSFEPYLVDTAQHHGYSVDQLLVEIKQWYDGYQFTRNKDAIKIYNPYSVLLFFSSGEFSNYWFQTGTPTFLINLLKSKNYPIEDFEHIEATESELGAFDIDVIPIKTLLFQTGYLTIRSYDPETTNYLLSYPNKECTNSLVEHVFTSMTSVSGAYLNNVTVALIKIFEINQIEQLQAALTKLFATIPYTIQIGEEKYYQTIFYLVLKMIGADIIVEQPTNIGRIDAVIQTKNVCFIIEFKINSTASKALEQIKNKKYYQSYQSGGKKIVLVGIAFDSLLKNVKEVEYVEM